MLVNLRDSSHVNRPRQRCIFAVSRLLTSIFSVANAFWLRQDVEATHTSAEPSRLPRHRLETPGFPPWFSRPHAAHGLLADEFFVQSLYFLRHGAT